jgi:hypothetical protein
LTFFKIFSKVIKKLEIHYQDIIGEEQNGFRKRRQCVDGYFSLKLLIEKHKELNKETHLTFIDYKKAFDSVNRYKYVRDTC